MPAPLPAPTVDRLAKVCGLLGSDHAGERATAAHQATELLKRHGLTWRDVIEGAFAAPRPATRGPPAGR